MIRINICKIRIIPLPIALIAVAMTLSACTNPVQKDVLKFQESSKALASAARDIYRHHGALVDRTNLEGAVLEYSSRDVQEFGFPAPQNQKAVDPKIWAARTRAMSGIARYAEALANLNDPTADDKAVGGLAALGDGVNDLAVGTDISIPSPLIALAQTSIGTALRARSAAAIRAAIAETQPMIANASKGLTEDFNLLNRLMREQRNIYTSAARFNLETAWHDPKTSVVDLQRAYREASATQDEIDDLIAEYGSFVGAISDFEKAHADLISSEDGDRALDDFLNTSRTLAENTAALTE